MGHGPVVLHLSDCGYAVVLLHVLQGLVHPGEGTTESRCDCLPPGFMYHSRRVERLLVS